MILNTFAKVFMVLVVLPAILALLAYGEYWIEGQPGVFSQVLFLPLSLYYLPPAILFGEPFFVGGIGAGPIGIAGLLVGCLFYSLISLLITLLYCVVQGAKAPDSE